MLKIKDNIDLKQLEKFGFEHVKKFNIYKTNISKKIALDSVLIVEETTRQLKMLVYGYYNSNWNNVENTPDLLFNLIQAGLIENEEDKDG